MAILLLTVASLRYENFLTARVMMNILTDNAFLGVAAVGMTLVILSGGIDLSVGAMIGCSGIMLASLVGRQHVAPPVAILLVLAFGTLVGYVHGVLIQRFRLAPFLVTLGGLFFCRGLALWISEESLQLNSPWFESLASVSIKLPGRASLTLVAMIWIAILIVGALLAKQTTFGRTIYAIGGSEPSAELMGLPVRRTKVGIYVVSGLLGALSGVVFSLYTGSGNAIAGTGVELDAIAAVVIGGTLLTGGYGSVLGSFLGVFILGLIQTAITFDGTLNSWWTKIVIGVLLLAFILLQKLVETLSQARPKQTTLSPCGRGSDEIRGEGPDPFP